MKRILGSAFAIAALVSFAAPPAHAAGREQVVVSGEAEGSLGEVGFWIWCAEDEAGSYDDCNGAMAFDDLGIVRHVEGEVEEISEDVYAMDVESTRDASVACALMNEEPTVHGRNNTVAIECSAPSGSAEASSAVVIAMTSRGSRTHRSGFGSDGSIVAPGIVSLGGRWSRLWTRRTPGTSRVRSTTSPNVCWSWRSPDR